jgi:AraC-like DNA-binding protein
MKVDEKGVLAESDYYFPISGALAKSMFFYPVCMGEFICDGSYHVERESYDSFLVMYVKSGSGQVGFSGKVYSAGAGDVILLDCYRAHQYKAGEKGWHTLWLHFDGSNSRAYYDLLNAREGCVLPAGVSSAVPRLLLEILEGYRQGRPLQEALLSCKILQLLTELLLISPEAESPTDPGSTSVAGAMEYIEANYAKKISLDHLSRQVNWSPFHFSRQFKRETGYSPYEYVIKVRLEHAKRLLKNTKLQVKEIAAACGFSSESNFVYRFHRNIGVSPRDFRNTPF